MALDKNNTGLILVDVQGKLAEQMHDSMSLFNQLKILLQGAQLLQLPVVWLEQMPDKLGTTRTEIAELIDGEPLAKETFSGLKNDVIKRTIQGHKRSHWLVAGIEAHICVYQTVMDLLAEKYDVHLVTDAVSSRTAANRELAIGKMENQGALLTSVEMALFELQRCARGDEFRELIRLVK